MIDWIIIQGPWTWVWLLSSFIAFMIVVMVILVTKKELKELDNAKGNSSL